MLILKDAVQIAKAFLIEFNGEQGNLQLEEVSLSSDGKRWDVIYSFINNFEKSSELQKTLGLDKRRVCKRIVIDNETKEVLGMFNWSSEKNEAA